jgi:putative nucleotidyltransferase with HDIG domain
MNAFSELQVDLRQMILALETAVDLVGMNDTSHAKRVGYIASQLAHRLGLSDQTVQFAFELGLLHDCGVSTQQMHTNLVNQFDWEDAHIHCEIGYRLLANFEPLARFATPIRYHHTHWNKLQTLDISPMDMRLANLVFLSDRVDVLASSHYGNDILLAKDEVVRSIASHAGDFFDPLIVDGFRELAQAESFWIALEDRHVMRFTWDMGQFQSTLKLSTAQLKQLSLIMAYIVDQKSPFTARHSARVAALARHLATLFGLLPEQCDKVEVAGLLHDIGKLRMPDAILEKPGSLSPAERSMMRQHSYETYEILRHIKGLEDVSLWAAYHHEAIAGTGYPFHPTQQELSIEARIIAVADVFQALVQDRPYRAGMSMAQAFAVIEDMLQQQKLDAEVVALLKKHCDKCFDIATGAGCENTASEMVFYNDADLQAAARQLGNG